MIGAGHQLLLVREQDAQHSGSGCCGRLGEAHTRFGGAADYGHTRAVMDQLGVVYRELAEHMPELELIVVDPRNTLWLYPALWRAARYRGAGVFATLRALARAAAPAAVVLDGETLFSGQLPEPERIVATVTARLDRSAAAA